MPLEDEQRTVGLVRLHAAEWHIDPHKIGVLGFSAGGHLSAVFFFQAEDGIRDLTVTGVQTCALPIFRIQRRCPDLLHPFYEAGNAAECGLCRYESAVFGADYRDNFFATTFNLHKVTRDRKSVV